MSRLSLVRLSAATLSASVGLGAMGAHLLEGRFTVGGADLWRTGSLYLALTSLGIGVLAAIPRELVGDRLAVRAASSAWFGSVVFAATLYGLALGGPRWLGAVTPVGGATMIGSWVAVAALAGRSRETR